MRQIDEKQQKAIALLGLAYRDFTPAQAQLYQIMLAEISADVLGKAIETIIKNSKWCPTVAEIRQKAEEIQNVATNTQAITAGMAWESVQHAIRKVGGYGRPSFKDPICAKVVSQMGWMDICMTPTEMTTALRAQFIKMYEREAAQNETERQIRGVISAQKLAQIAMQVSERLRIEGGAQK